MYISRAKMIYDLNIKFLPEKTHAVGSHGKTCHLSDQEQCEDVGIFKRNHHALSSDLVYAYITDGTVHFLFLAGYQSLLNHRKVFDGNGFAIYGMKCSFSGCLD
jgi:hypothetical protein